MSYPGVVIGYVADEARDRDEGSGGGGASGRGDVAAVHGLLEHYRSTFGLQFDFALRVPYEAELLPYQFRMMTRRSDLISSIELQLCVERFSTIAVSLWWPFEEVTELFLKSHDAIFDLLGILPRPAGWVRGMPRTKHRRFAFDRGRFVPPPDDEVGRRVARRGVREAGRHGGAARVRRLGCEPRRSARRDARAAAAHSGAALG